jgi:hypothetical protein
LGPNSAVIIIINKSLLSIVFVLGAEMTHHLNNKKENIIAAATTTLFILATILVIAGTAATVLIGINQSADAAITMDSNTMRMRGLAPVVVSGDNIYVAWWTNNTENGNEEVMFRASNDGGQTFGDKINLSNTTDADSWRVEIAAEGENVAVSWWETTGANQTEGAVEEAIQDIPVMRVSNDAGQTFGPLLRLAANGTIGAEGGGGEAVEEAVGGPAVAE